MPTNIDDIVRTLPSASRKKIATMKRGYSREFPLRGDVGQRYLLDKIPTALWSKARTKAKREGVSVRALILRLVKDWVDSQ